MVLDLYNYKHKQAFVVNVTLCDSFRYMHRNNASINFLSEIVEV